MELTELQGVWSAYDKKLEQNMQINKQILRTMLIVKPGRKINWMQLRAGAGLVFFIAVFVLFLSIIKSREPDFKLYGGRILLALVFMLSFSARLLYFILLMKTDMMAPVLKIKEHIIRLKVYKIQADRIAFLLIPFSLIAIAMIVNVDLRVFATNYIPVTIAAVAVFIKWSIRKWVLYKQLDELNNELREIEELER